MLKRQQEDEDGACGSDGHCTRVMRQASCNLAFALIIFGRGSRLRLIIARAPQRDCFSQIWIPKEMSNFNQSACRATTRLAPAAAAGCWPLYYASLHIPFLPPLSCHPRNPSTHSTSVHSQNHKPTRMAAIRDMHLRARVDRNLGSHKAYVYCTVMT